MICLTRAARIRLTIILLIQICWLIPGLVPSSSATLVFAQSPPWKAATPHQSHPHTFHLIHSVIRVSFDEDKRLVIGSVTHRLRPLTDGLKTVSLDAIGLQIQSVKQKNETDLHYKVGPKQLDIDLDHTYKKTEEIEFTVTYTAAEPTKGIYFIQPDSGYPTKPRQVWSQGESEETSHWEPTYDAPDDKETTELFITAPARYTTVANGKLTEITTNPDGAKTWHWREDKSHSTYLTSLAIGEYKEVDQPHQGIPVIYYTYPNRETEGRLVFEKTPAMVDYFSRIIGYPYPYEKYSQVVVADFTAGGMENVSATTMADTLLHDQRTHQDITYEDYVSHELAHQWWGDLVTCRDWSDIWLNEGFATFFEKVWTEHDLGSEQAAYWKLDYQRQYLQEAKDYQRPIVYTYYSNPDDLFDRHAYAKGGLVLNMLRFVLGEDLFWKALNHYIHKFEYQNADTHDFKVAVEEATGQKLDWFFDEWLYHPGHPEFEVSQQWDDANHNLKLNVKQVQKRDNEVPIFRMPVDIETETTSGKQVHHIQVDRAEQSFTFHLDSRPRMVIFDKGDWILKTLKFTKPQEDLVYQLEHAVDISDRQAAATDLVQFGGDAKVVLALRKSLLSDNYWSVSAEAATALGAIKSDAAREALIAGYRNAQSKVRTSVVAALGNFQSDDVSTLLQKAIFNDTSYFTQAAAVTALSKVKGSQSFDIIKPALDIDSYGNKVRQAAITALAAWKDPQAVPIVLKYLAYGQDPSLRQAALGAAIELGPGNQTVISALLPLLHDKQPTIRGATTVVLAELGVTSAIPAIAGLAQSDPSEEVRAAATTAVTRLQSVAKPAKTGN